MRAHQIEIKFPIIGDSDRTISTAYGMIDPGTSGDQSLPLTIRAVFIINPENKLMLTLNYPACVGRNMDEIVRCVQALQLSYQKSIATPANWPNNHADFLMPDGSRTEELKGSVFLLPTVSPEEARAPLPTPSCGCPPSARLPAPMGSICGDLPCAGCAQADAAYPGYHTCDVPSGKPYLRLVKQDVVSGAPAA